MEISKEAALRVTDPPLFIWLAANLLGWGIPAALIAASPPFLATVGPLVSVLIVGLPPGVAQWLALRRLRPVSPLWLVSIPLGLTLGAALIGLLPESWLSLLDDESPLLLALLYALAGGGIGLLQGALITRRPGRILVWTAASAAGLGAGLWLALVTDLINRSEWLGYMLLSLVYGLLTAAALGWLGRSATK